MQAIGLKNRISLHSIDGSNLKIRGSLSFGTGGHFRKSAEGSLSFGISSMDRMDAIRSEFEARVQRRLFEAAAPVFENILHKR